jgi:hypothetical protein
MEQNAIDKVLAQRNAVANAVEKTGELKTDGEAAGYALAESAIGFVKNQAADLVRIVARLSVGSVETRAAFMKYLGQHTRQMQAHVKTTEGTPENEMYKKASASARTRVSEMTTIAKAMNGGYELAVKRDDTTGVPLVSANGQHIPVLNFHYIVAECRVFLQSDAAGKVGRPAKPFLDKLKAFMLKETEGMDIELARKVYADAAEATAMMVKLADAADKNAAPF